MSKIYIGSVVTFIDLLGFKKAFTQILASRFLQEGFLSCGGITYGKLYHKNSIVFGEALYDAVNLESFRISFPCNKTRATIGFLEPTLSVGVLTQGTSGFISVRSMLFGN